MIRVTISGVTVTQNKKNEIAQDVEKCLDDILKRIRTSLTFRLK